MGRYVKLTLVGRLDGALQLDHVRRWKEWGESFKQ